MPLKGIFLRVTVPKVLCCGIMAIHNDRLEGVCRMAYSDLDDVDYLLEDNVMDEFPYHRRWKRPVVEWHIGGASWEQNANAGNDSGNWGRTQQ